MSKVTGGAVPKEYIPSVRKGFEEAMQSGPLAGYPMDSLQVILLDGKTHSDDSHAYDFEIAAKEGFREAARLSNPVLLEPVMRLEVRIPEEYLGAVTGDLNKRRGVILELTSEDHLRVIVANVPMAELFGYIMDLRSNTRGRGSAEMQFAYYDTVPASISEAVLTS